MRFVYASRPTVVGACVATRFFVTGLAHAANPPPTISGTPATWVYVGSTYYFRPAATDPEARRCASRSPTSRRGRASAPQAAALGTPTTVGIGPTFASCQRRHHHRAAGVLDPRAARQHGADDVRHAGRPRVVIGLQLPADRRRTPNGDALASAFVKPAWATFRRRRAASAARRPRPTSARIRTSDQGHRRRDDVAAGVLDHGAPALPTRAPTISGRRLRPRRSARRTAFRPTAADANGTR